MAMEECQITVDKIMGVSARNPTPAFNVYDIRKKCDKPPLCYDFSPMDKFLAK